MNTYFRKNIIRKWLVVLPFLGAILLLIAMSGALGHALAAPIQPQPLQPEFIGLDIGVRASVQTVRPGDIFSYTITYSNTTAQSVSNVVVTATISGKQIWNGTYQAVPPPGTFQSSGNEIDGYTLSWHIGTLSAGAQGSIIFDVQVVTSTEPNSASSIIFLGTSAIITTTQPGVSGVQADDVVIVTGPLLEIDKAAASTTVRPGHLLEYSLTVSNIARQDSIAATNLVISDVLPEFSTFYRASDGGYYSPTLGSVLWNWPGPLNPGANKVFTFSVKIQSDARSNSTIRNTKKEYYVTSQELWNGPLQGKRDVSVRIISLFEKSVVSAAGGSGAPQVYPDELVTYTLTVYNPLTETLTGVVVTDTLPGAPLPFIYVRPGGGSPPDGLSADGRSLTWTVDLPPWGWITRTFVAQIPRETEIARNRTETTYLNALDARHELTSFPPEFNLAPVKVQAAVIMNKVASANHVMDGETVVYTITLTNRVDFTVTNITLTDTLEGQFHYIRMLQGPDPLPGHQGNPVVWQGLNLTPGQEIELAFEARVKGDWLVTYNNSLDAHSPDVFIPSRYRIAPVKVDPPLGINKSVMPQQTFINNNVTYAITITNVSTVPFTLANNVRDYLPAGFYQVGGDNPGGNPAQINLPSPVVLPPGGSWYGNFTALLSMDYGCNKLPKTIKNMPGSILTHITSPLDVYVTNGVGLAPLTLNPNIQVDLEVPHHKMLRSEIFNYTVHLLNVSNVPANNSSMEIILPTDIQYLQTLSGTPPNVNGQTLSWSSLNIPANSEKQIILQAQVSPTAAAGNKNPVFSASAYGVCFSSAGGGPFKDNGNITVVDHALVLYKRATTTNIPPLAQATYEIKLENKLDYEYTIQSLTDTLPSGFTYYMMDIGNDPVSYDADHIIWKNITVPKGTTLWKMRLLASPLYGSYDNQIAGYIDALRSVQVDTDRSPKDGQSDALVTVLPIFDLSKAVSPQYTPPDRTIVYTITMLNQSDVNYSAIRITDTLPSGFTYYRTLSGPIPASIGADKRTLVWNNLTVPGNCSPTNMTNCTSTIIIEVYVARSVNEGVYYNTIEGYSPSGAIPGPIDTAPITITQRLGSDIYLPLILK
ncbi:MAG: hypothetical protein Fur0018_12770 [Anaerolineales bacterium]